MREKKCRTCGRELQDSTLSTFTGSSGTVQVSFIGLPVLVCPQGHEKRMVDPEFPLHVLENILADIPWSVEKGFVLKQYFCRKCNSLLQVTDAGPGEQFNLKIPWRSNASDAILAVPSIKCPACLTVQILKTKKLRLEDIPNAIVDAFDKAGLQR